MEFIKRQPRFNQQRRVAMMTALSATLVPFSDAIAQRTNYPELRLNFYNLHTTERLNIVFWADGQYDFDAISKINHLLRDHRTNDVIQIDLKLMSILCLINLKTGNNKSLSVISGYRSAETNRKLALINNGVAKNSYHIKGKAIDIRIPGKDTSQIRDAGLNLRVGGVGYYNKSDFVHLDTGPRRHWTA